MGKKNKNCVAPMATVAAVKKDIRNPDALRTRTSGSDAAREAKVQASTRQVFKAYAHAHPHEPAPLLARDELVPDQPGFIVAVADFLSSVECARLCTAIDDVGLNPPNGADLNPRKNEAFLCRHSLSFVDPYLQQARGPSGTDPAREHLWWRRAVQSTVFQRGP